MLPSFASFAIVLLLLALSVTVYDLSGCACCGGDEEGTIECGSNPGELMLDTLSLEAALGPVTVTSSAPFESNVSGSGIPGWNMGSGSQFLRGDGSAGVGGVQLVGAYLLCLGTEGDWYVKLEFALYNFTPVQFQFPVATSVPAEGDADIALVIDSTDPFSITATVDLSDLGSSSNLDEAFDGLADRIVTVRFFEPP